MDSSILIFAVIFGLAIILAPTILFIILTIILFHKGEQTRIAGNLTEVPSPTAKGIIYACPVIASVLIILNIIVMISNTLPDGIVYAGWDLTVLWTLAAWIPILISLINLKDKGLKYRKWFVIIWILNFLVFLTGVMNPIPKKKKKNVSQLPTT